jgi:hypothetical protein
MAEIIDAERTSSDENTTGKLPGSRKRKRKGKGKAKRTDKVKQTDKAKQTDKTKQTDEEDNDFISSSSKSESEGSESDCTIEITNEEVSQFCKKLSRY